MSRVLLANELGGGLGHLAILRPLASSLARLGCEVVLATPSTTAPAMDGVARSARWTSIPEVTPPATARRALRTRSFDGSLVDAGFADTQYVLEKLKSWRALLEKLRPDLVICNHAPFVHLAARDDAFVSWVGTGFEIPPSRPVSNSRGDDGARNDRVLSAIRAAQRELKLELLDRLDSVFPPESHYIVTVPELDPHARHRTAPHEGPLTTLNVVRDAAARTRASVFVYLAQESPNCVAILSGLSRAGVRARAVVLGDVQPPWRDNLPGVEFEVGPVSIAKALAESTLVIHHGGLSLTQEALFAGVPQLTAPRFEEQRLNGAALERLGTGISRSNPPASMVVRTVLPMLEDDQLHDRCDETARRLRAAFPTGSANSIAERCLRSASSARLRAASASPSGGISRELPL